MELIDDQPGRGAPRKSAQSKLPLPPPKSPSPAPQPPQPTRLEPADPKRRREQKGEDVVKAGRARPTREDEAQKAAKQQKVSYTSHRGMERSNTQSPEP